MSKILDIKKDTEVFMNEIRSRKSEIDSWFDENLSNLIKLKSFDENENT